MRVDRQRDMPTVPSTRAHSDALPSPSTIVVADRERLAWEWYLKQMMDYVNAHLAQVCAALRLPLPQSHPVSLIPPPPQQPLAQPSQAWVPPGLSHRAMPAALPAAMPVYCPRQQPPAPTATPPPVPAAWQPAAIAAPASLGLPPTLPTDRASAMAMVPSILAALKMVQQYSGITAAPLTSNIFNTAWPVINTSPLPSPSSTFNHSPPISIS